MMQTPYGGHTSKVYRPLGLSLAILAGAVLFGLWPLVKLYFSWRLNQSSTPEVMAEGVLQVGVSLPLDGLSYLTALLGALVLATALLAWRGRPAQTRFIFQGLILLTCLSLIGETIYRLSQADAGLGSSLDGSVYAALRCQVPFQILLSFYIIWYCNRAPARAFYRQEMPKH